MPVHTLSRSTRTIELVQVDEINARLRQAVDDPQAPGAVVVTAEALGLAGATVHVGMIDRAAALVIPLQERRRELPALAGSSLLRRVLATGSPSAPYLYGVFAEAPGRRELPVGLHTDHLREISLRLRLRLHLWGV